MTGPITFFVFLGALVIVGLVSLAVLLYLRRSKAQIQAVEEIIGASAIPTLLSQKNKVVFANAEAIEVFAELAVEPVGQSLFGLFSGNAGLDELRQAFRKVEKISNLKVCLKTSDGLEKWVQVSFVPLNIDRPTVAVISFVDLNREKILLQNKPVEMQQRRSHPISDLNQNTDDLTHDLNNLIGAIVGFAGFIEQDTEVGTQPHVFAKKITDAGERAKTLLAQNMDFDHESSKATRPLNLAAPKGRFAIRPEPSEEATTEDIIGTGRIMIIDDDIDVGDTLSMALERLGYEVAVCSNPVVGFESFSEAPDVWDMLIVDQNMPVMKGTELIAKVREHNDVPIILCSGYNDELFQHSELTIGADLFMQKPLNMQKLSANISQLLSQNSPQDSPAMIDHNPRDNT